MIVEPNIGLVKSLLFSYLNKSLDNVRFVQGCKAICFNYEPPETPYSAYIHQYEMQEIIEKLQSYRVSRASQWVEGYHWHSLMTWLIQDKAPRTKYMNNLLLSYFETAPKMPDVRDVDKARAIKKLVTLFNKKVGDRIGR